MICEIHAMALQVLVTGAIPIILLGPDDMLHLYTIVPADESALEAFCGPDRIKALVGASVAVMNELENE